MLFKNIFISLILVLISVFAVNADVCQFGDYNSDCVRFTNSFVTFNLNFDDIDNYAGDLNVEIYNRDFPANKISVKIEDSIKVKNIEPFVSSGVYVLRVLAKNKGGEITTKNFEFIYDNSKPMPPVIPLNYFYGDSLINIQGSTQFPNTEVHMKIGGNDEKIISDLNGNFNFSNVGLSSGLNLVKFYTHTYIDSEIIERVIYGGYKPSFSDSILITGITIDTLLQNLNDYTIYNSGADKYITSKRNFYISGTSNPNGVVYINGNPTPVDANGKYGGFILLNEGVNKVVVESKNGEVFKNIFIEFISHNFQFLEFNTSKVVSSSSTIITGKVNYKLNFDVYLNGNYIKTFNYLNYLDSGIFSFSISGLVPGKNNLLLKGLNGEEIYSTIYYDSELPEIKFVGSNKIANNNELFFKVTDDIGFDINDLEISIGSTSFQGNDLNVKGDYYYIDISDIEDGSYQYLVQVVDRVGKSNSLSGNININKDNVLIDYFKFDGLISNLNSDSGFVMGNDLYVKSGMNRLVLIPSKLISFNKIYLDGKEIIDYEISSSGEVNINLNFENDTGVLKFEFMDKTRQSVFQEFNYFTNSVSPKVDLNYIRKPLVSGVDRVLVSGKIISNIFDWNSLRVNGGNFIRYGNNFESNVELVGDGINNLVISGNDYFGNNIENNSFGSLLFKDSTNVNLIFQNFQRDGFNGTIDEPNSRIYEYINSYDGLNIGGAYINTNFKLPSVQRLGLRSINLKGIKESGIEFNDYDLVSIDILPPKIYFINFSTGKLKIVVDGTLSDVDDNSLIIIDGSGNTITPISECNDYNNYFTHSKCYELDLNGQVYIEINVSDVFGNSVKTEYHITDGLNLPNFENSKSKIYFNGNNKLTSDSHYFLQGQIRGTKPITSVTLDGSDCVFDDFNFVCSSDLSVGMNSLDVKVITLPDIIDNEGNLGNPGDDDSIVEDHFDVELVSDYDFGLKLLNLSGNDLYYYDGNYYLIGDELEVSGYVNKSNLISVLVDGEEYLTGIHNNSFLIDVNMSNAIIGKEKSDLKIQLKAEDEFGNVQLSNIISLIYRRVLETLVSVVIQ